MLGILNNSRKNILSLLEFSDASFAKVRDFANKVTSGPKTTASYGRERVTFS